MTALKQAFFLLACWTLAASVHASYGQMRLDGLSLMLVFGLTVSYGLFVDLALFARLFRNRTALVICSIVGLGLAFLLLSQLVSPRERAALLGTPGGPAWNMVMVTSAVILPFIVIAPFAQYAAMRHGRRWPRWITAWMVLQLALVPGFLVLAGTEEYFERQEYAAGRALGLGAKPGRFGEMVQFAEQRPVRIWGTPWARPGHPRRRDGSPYVSSAWIRGLALGIDESAPIAANEPLSESDRRAMRTLFERYLRGYAVRNIRAKLIWDALEPGSFSSVLTPKGIDELGVIDEDAFPGLLERLEKYGRLRLCPGGRMMDADRAVLNAVILKRGRTWNAEKRVYELRPKWDGYRLRVEQLCRGPQ